MTADEFAHIIFRNYFAMLNNPANVHVQVIEGHEIMVQADFGMDQTLRFLVSLKVKEDWMMIGCISRIGDFPVIITKKYLDDCVKQFTND